MEKSSWNRWVGVVKIPLCSVGWGRGELKENWVMLEVNRKVLLKWRIGMSQGTPELLTGKQGGRAESSNIFFSFFFLCVWWYGKRWVISTTPVQFCYVVILFIIFLGGDDRTLLKFCNFGCYCLYIFFVVELYCNLLWINDKGKRGRYVALYGWPAKADDSFVCFGAKPDKGFLDLKSHRIRKW